MLAEPSSSPRLERVIAYADAEAARLQHEYIGTEHLLLGLIREGEGVAIGALRQLGVDTARVAATIEQLVTRGQTTVEVARRPFTSRAKEAMTLARRAADELHHSYLGTEHLLLGLLGEGQGPGAQILHQVGVTSDAARRETLRCLLPLKP